MQNLEFEWDDDKAQKNLLKHGIDFRDAVQIFFDPWAVEEFDDREEYGGNRFRVIGLVQGRVVLVAYAERRGTIRLISARAASSEERRTYEDSRKR